MSARVGLKLVASEESLLEHLYRGGDSNILLFTGRSQGVPIWKAAGAEWSIPIFLESKPRVEAIAKGTWLVLQLESAQMCFFNYGADWQP